MNTRAYHWNIKGDKFFELHLKFEEPYNNALLKVDEIAERILTLGYTPMHSYSEYIKYATIKERVDISDGYKAVEFVVDSFKTLLLKERDLLTFSAETNDEGTNALMCDYIREQEELVWMYSSFFAKEINTNNSSVGSLNSSVFHTGVSLALLDLCRADCKCHSYP